MPKFQNLKLLLSFFLLVCLISGSCVSYKDIPYFQDLPQEIRFKQDSIQNFNSVTIQPNDLIDLKVSSPDLEASLLFNRPNNTINITNTTNIQSTEGYLVDQLGFIQLPIIGSIKVGGLTTSQAKDFISKKLTPSIKDPVVSSIRILNFNISVFGDVANPGIYPVTNERITVLEAIVRAGDLTAGALRKNILLIREVEGKRQFIRLDIESKDIFTSPYFYLRSNDVIYAQPGNKKEKRDLILSNAGILTSLVTFLLFLLK